MLIVTCGPAVGQYLPRLYPLTKSCPLPQPVELKNVSWSVLATNCPTKTPGVDAAFSGRISPLFSLLTLETN